MESSVGEFRYGHARDSLWETETQILLSERLEYLDKKTTEKLIAQAAEPGRILGSMNSLGQSRR